MAPSFSPLVVPRSQPLHALQEFHSFSSRRHVESDLMQQQRRLLHELQPSPPHATRDLPQRVAQRVARSSQPRALIWSAPRRFDALERASRAPPSSRLDSAV
jgi:hypothetical protein